MGSSKERTRNRVIVVGGGLAGLTACHELLRYDYRPLLVDSNPVASEQSLGGFAKFSGAKFSFPPAGLGLAEPVGGLGELDVLISEATSLLDIDNLTPNGTNEPYSEENGSNLRFRKYDSVVLTPGEIDKLISNLTGNLFGKIEHHRGFVSSIQATTCGVSSSIETSNSETLSRETAAVIFAGGRASAPVLINAGAVPIYKKGLDVGFRIQVSDLAHLEGMRSLGPDAKILSGMCRTFCLNSPGQIYWYDWEGFSIPGGVVAGAEEPRANVGVLYRSDDREGLLRRMNVAYKSLEKRIRRQPIQAMLCDRVEVSNVTEQLYGVQIGRSIDSFLDELVDSRLLPARETIDTLFPLIDWHWPTFAEPKSFRTSLERVYVAGDAAGHARGLLQAVVSGMAAARQTVADLGAEC